MLLLPHLKEVLLGPSGAALSIWFLMVVWLGGTQRLATLGILLALTAIALGVAAAGAYEMSAAHNSPSRYGLVVLSGLFLTFSLAAFVSGTVAMALITPSIRKRWRKS